MLSLHNSFHQCAFSLSLLAAVALAGTDARADDDQTFEIEWSTYLGGAGTERNAHVAIVGDSVFIAAMTDGAGAPTTGKRQWDTMLVRLDTDGDQQFSTYFGGGGTEYVAGIAVGEAKSTFVVGATKSKTGVAKNAADGVLDGEQDGFLAKFDDDGELLWSTYVGGEGEDVILAVVFDDDDEDVFVCGLTTSKQGMTKGNAHQGQLRGEMDAFVARYTDDGKLKWSTYLGGDGVEECTTLAIRGDRLLVGGWTDSDSGIATKKAHKVNHDTEDGIDGFVAKFQLDGDRQWATLIGGEGTDLIQSLDFDEDGEIYVAGTTDSAQGIATAKGHQQDLGGDRDLFVVRFGDSGKRKWGTYYGGEGDEMDARIAVREEHEIYLAGVTESKQNIVAGDVLDGQLSGKQDLFVAKFSSSGERRRSTYFGGSKGEMHPTLALRGGDTIFLAGATNSKDLTLMDAIDDELEGDADLFICRLEE